MADSSDNKNDEQSADFADDLDAMLNDVESSMDEEDDFIDDEDAIDRLLMDDGFNVDVDEFSEDEAKSIIDDAITQTEQEQQKDDDNSDEFLEESNNDTDKVDKETDDSEDEFDVDDLINSVAAEPEVDEFAEIDEFGEEESDAEPVVEKQQSADQQESDEFDVDDLINSVEAEPEEEADEFAEKDEVTEDKNANESVAEQPEESAEQEVDDFDVDDLINSASIDSNEVEEKQSAEADDDFLIADFDISSDDEEAESSSSDELLEVDNSTDLEQKADDSDNEKQPETAQKSKAKKEKSPPELDELNVQISQLWEENEQLKKQIDDVVNSPEKTDQIAEEIDSLQKDQRKFRRELKENESKVPVITYIAIGIAILALLIGGGLGAIGYGAQTEVTDLTELVATLEEEIEILTAKDPAKDIGTINKKLDLLSDKDKDINTQLVDMNQALQSDDPLQTVVDDLVVQNDHAQKAIELLLAKVGSLEQRKYVSASKKKVKKAVPKLVWVVNLVSFKQQWYANRKALEYEKKGIPATVAKVKVNGENWFRLTVKGFKSKYEAAAYAVKVKKTLNLTEVWVTKG